MYEEKSDASMKSRTSPVRAKDAHDSVLHHNPRTKIRRNGSILLGLLTLCLVVAGLGRVAGNPGHQDNESLTNANLSASAKEQTMNPTNQSDQSSTTQSHHVSLNVNQKSSTSTSSSTSVNSSTSTTGGATTSTDVVVNGQHIAVPQNGSVHKTIPSSDGNANVDINVDSSGNGSSSSSSSMDVNISSDSQSSSDTGGQ